MLNLHKKFIPMQIISSFRNSTGVLVSSPGRDSRDIRSSRLAEATQKPLGTNAL